jgi:hypothetical protein
MRETLAIKNANHPILLIISEDQAITILDIFFRKLYFFIIIKPIISKGRLIINVSEHSSIFDRKLLPQISIFFPNSKRLFKYTLK